jgi:alpha-galactosidase
MEQVIAAKLRTPPNSQGFPQVDSWMNAPAVSFSADWRGENPDPERETTARLLWSFDRLFFRFDCRYRQIFVYAGGGSRRDELWLRDVAEVFICPESESPNRYREFEVSPNGDWLDLDISPDGKSVLFCDLKSNVVVDPVRRIWTAELAVPMNCLTASFDPGRTWRLNLFRIEGKEPNRFYSAWRPTCTARANFHVPEVFGSLHFQS